MKSMILPASDPNTLFLAEEAILSGAVIAFPTDTVYGIGGLVTSPEAIQEIYRIKGRSFDKPLPVMVASVDQLEQVAGHVPPEAGALARAFWPGALTIVLAKHPDLPQGLTTLPTVGVRIPDHAFALALLHRCGSLAVTSANLSGQPEALNAGEVQDQLGDLLGLIVDGGQSPGGRASTVVDLSTGEGRILREGPISKESIHRILVRSRSGQGG